MRRRRKKPAQRPREFLGRRRGVGDTEHRRELSRDRRTVPDTLTKCGQLRTHLFRGVLLADPGQLPHELSNRPEGDSCPVREAAAAYDSRLRADMLDQLTG